MFCVALIGDIGVHNSASRSLPNRLAKVVPGRADIGLAQGASPVGALPGRQPHVGPVWIGSLMDQLGGRAAGHRIEHPVLDRRAQSARVRRVGIVVLAEGEEFAQLPVEPRLAGPNAANALKEFVEAVPGGILQPPVIHDEALDEMLRQRGRGPAAKLRAAGAAHAASDSEDGIQAVELAPAGLRVCGSCQGFLCGGRENSRLKISSRALAA